MSSTKQAWTASSLEEALKALPADAGITTNRIEESDVLEVSVASAGDFVLYVVVGEAQILTAAILWPRDEQENPEEFEAMMLRSHKTLLPLCALSIDVIDGREYYELFGAISRDAALKELLEEFSLIADSALELAGDIGPGAQQKEGAA